MSINKRTPEQQLQSQIDIALNRLHAECWRFWWTSYISTNPGAGYWIEKHGKDAKRWDIIHRTLLEVKYRG